MNKDWLKLAQKLFFLCVIIGLLMIVLGIINPNSNGNEDLGFAMYIIGFPFLMLLSLLTMIGSIVNIKNLTKIDWIFFVVSGLLLISSVAMLVNFYR